ncbi:glycosyltransferase [Thermosynechococcus vestitus]|uniref:glycosyltransferase n=1 Tax=Thermosynechococcus vestitus TaxID=146786 RepID=UPI0013E8D01C|nr:glycosyltransferase [Thermosynechococcus vestitus]
MITATYNAAQHLPGLIESVRQQSDRAFEWIVIDGASEDGTLDLIRGAQDVITDYVSEPDFGIFHALNKGIQRATGDYYLVVGADDRLDPLAIANYKQAAASSQADLISAYIYSEKKAIIKPTGGAIWHHGVQAFITTQSVGTLIKRNLHEHYGYYSHYYPTAADALFILKVQQGGGKITTAEFIAGQYNTKGFSYRYKANLLCELFLIQKEFFPKSIQLLLLIYRLIKNYRYL